MSEKWKDIGLGMGITPRGRRFYVFKMGLVELVSSLLALVSFGYINTNWELSLALSDAQKSLKKAKAAKASAINSL